MFLKNLAIASSIEAHTARYLRYLQMYVDQGSIIRLRRQLVTLDKLRDEQVDELEPEKYASIFGLSQPIVHNIVIVTKDESKDEKDGESDESKDKKSNSNRRKNPITPEEPQKIPVPYEREVIEKSAVMSAIKMAARAVDKIEMRGYVADNILDTIRFTIEQTSNRDLLKKIAAELAKARVLR